MFVLLITGCLLLLFIYGDLRKRINISGLDLLMKGIYILTPLGITYLMGLMHDASVIHDLFPYWAMLLIYIHGGSDTMTALCLSDNERALQFWLHVMPLFFSVIYLTLFFTKEIYFFYPLLFFYLLAQYNARETQHAFYLASKSKGLPELTLPFVQYMRTGEGEGKDVPEELADPVSMRGYKYLLTSKSKSVTIEDVWISEKRLLDTKKGGKSAENLKDLCLSYALFWLLLRRFAGFTLAESAKEKTRRFVETGLLSSDPRRLKRTFRIIELELDFTFQFFYTKFGALGLFKWATLRKCVRLFLFALYVVFSFHFITVVKGWGKTEVWVTRGVVAAMFVLEVWQLSVYMMSNWKIVTLLYEYVDALPPNPGSCTWNLPKLLIKYIERRNAASGKRNENQIAFSWAMKEWFSRRKCLHFFYKPWQRKLGQYLFVQSYHQDPAGKKLSDFLTKTYILGTNPLKTPRSGQAGNFSVQLSIQVKQAIVSSLVNNVLHLSRGTTTLGKYEAFRCLSYACELETDAEVILVWHIATSACEFFSAKEDKDDNFFVATQLSKYCAYLVAFAPELLVDHCYTTECAFDKAVIEASEIFGRKKMQQRYHHLKTITEEGDGSTVRVPSTNTVHEGAVLANKLRALVVKEPSEGWRVLAEFWAELLLYMVPSDNAEAHGEHLAKGGEFITHLWALLTHAGIVTRADSPPLTESVV